MSDWSLWPFARVPGAVLRAQPDLPWASKDLFNPGAIVREGRVCLLVRGEDATDRYAGVSRIGVATSEDGISFDVETDPVLEPADDEWAPWEGAAGCEDARVVESPEGGYVCTYTGFDGKVGTLMVATSDDLRTWQKRGPAFAGTPYARRGSKSGAIVTEVRDGRLVAARVRGTFWMYWGEGICFAASSDDLVRWTPVEFDATGDRYLTYDGSWRVHRVPGHKVLKPILFPRVGRFDSLLVEPGPPAVVTDHGIVLLYNGADAATFAYQAGQALFDPLDPTVSIGRTTEPFLSPAAPDEREGQVPDVCFAQGLVLFNGEWRLYFGMADSRVGCAVAPARRS